MDWPYHLLDLSSEQKHQRRVLLDRYGVYAQLSTLLPVLAYQLYRLARWVNVARRRQEAAYDAVPSSPRLKHAKLKRTDNLLKRWRSIVWWLDAEVVEGWGTRGHCITGGLWGAWLLFLCMHRTGEDYLHLTKRFGTIAASQLPLHYMLSMKSLYSPLIVAFRTSHERLNPYHRISGRLIYALLVLHFAFYINFFIQASLFKARLTSVVVWIGIIALLSMSILMSTTLQVVRSYSYRIFFITHLVLGVSILPLLFFHASPLRLYVTEALALFIFDILARKLDTLTAFTTITRIPGTDLLRLDIPISSRKINRFKAAPGQHVYLHIPQESVPKSSLSTRTASLHEILYNPFTIATVSDTSISLVMRILAGPTTQALSQLSHLRKAHPPLHIEGPLGSSVEFFSELADAREWDRVLLIAGGVGATFCVPIYRQLLRIAEGGRGLERLRFIWSVRSADETRWVFSTAHHGASDTANSAAFAPEVEEESIELYITSPTRGISTTSRPGSSGVDIQLDNLGPQPGNGKQIAPDTHTRAHKAGRPDLRRIVDEVFRLGHGHGTQEKVAVLVCGPAGMASDVRRAIGSWVEKGRVVWFHNENFGW